MSGVSGCSSCNSAKVAQVAGDYQAAVAKKSLDVQKQAGDDTLQLIKSATVAEPGSKGNKVDITV